MNTKNYVVWKVELRQDTQFLQQTEPHSKFGKVETAKRYTLKQAIKIVHSFKKDLHLSSSVNYGYDRLSE